MLYTSYVLLSSIKDTVFQEFYSKKVCVYNLVIRQPQSGPHIANRSNNTLYINFHSVNWDSDILRTY